MRLSHSLHRGILEAQAGRILNKIQFKKRRNIMFFEGISANYIKECEKKGYGDRMYQLGEKWFSLIYSRLVPSFTAALPKKLLLPMLGSIWQGIGTIDSISVSLNGDNLIIKTENEAITRCIGPNKFMAGVYAGAYGIIFGRKLKCLKCEQGWHSSYTYKLGAAARKPPAKTRGEFNKLNKMPIQPGFTIKDALRSGIFTSKNNKIYFRGSLVSITDSTIYHLVANEGPLMGDVARISHRLFSRLVKKESTNGEKLRLLKTLFQTMGWGIFTVSGDMKSSITVQVKHPPYGFQIEKDNWGFLIQALLGYLWLINPKLKAASTKIGHQRLLVHYSI